MMKALPTLAKGATGAQVRTVQALCVARGQAVTVDGILGDATARAVMVVQHTAGITADGVVGAQTWPALLGV